jgi:hypothetical protein
MVNRAIAENEMRFLGVDNTVSEFIIRKEKEE